MKIAAVQMRSGTKPEANLAAIEAAVAEAAGQGAAPSRAAPRSPAGTA